MGFIDQLFIGGAHCANLYKYPKHWSIDTQQSVVRDFVQSWRAPSSVSLGWTEATGVYSKMAI